MEAATATNGRRRPRRAKKEKPAEEPKVVKLDPLTPNAIRMLESGYRQAQESARILTDGLKNIGEKCGMKPSALRAFIAARVGEKYEEKKEQVRQLSLLFEEIGS